MAFSLEGLLLGLLRESRCLREFPRAAGPGEQFGENFEYSEGDPRPTGVSSGCPTFYHMLQGDLSSRASSEGA